MVFQRLEDLEYSWACQFIYPKLNSLTHIQIRKGPPVLIWSQYCFIHHAYTHPHSTHTPYTTMHTSYTAQHTQTTHTSHPHSHTQHTPHTPISTPHTQPHTAHTAHIPPTHTTHFSHTHIPHITHITNKYPSYHTHITHTHTEVAKPGRASDPPTPGPGSSAGRPLSGKQFLQNSQLQPALPGLLWALEQ